MQAVILSFDSLAANSLGCYGNEWVETPNWDRLAATGVVFDRHFANTIGDDVGMTWASRKPPSTKSTATDSISLGSRLRSAGITTAMIVAGQQKPWQHRAEFDSLTTVMGREGHSAEPHEVPVAQLIKAGLSSWTETRKLQQQRLLWLHAPGPTAPPIGFDSLYFEDFEERGQNVAELSDEGKAQHPAVYGGAVSLIDYWLGELVAGIESQLNAEPTILIVTAAMGQLVYQVDRTDLVDSLADRSILTDQCIRTPLVLRVFGNRRYEEFGSTRMDRLVQSCDLYPTLLDWFAISQNEFHSPTGGESWLRELTEESPERQMLWIRSDSRYDALRTSKWLCIRDKTYDSSMENETSRAVLQAALFEKPEDIWDINDLAGQYPELVSDLCSRFPVH